MRLCGCAAPSRRPAPGAPELARLAGCGTAWHTTPSPLPAFLGTSLAFITAGHAEAGGREFGSHSHVSLCLCACIENGKWNAGLGIRTEMN